MTVPINLETSFHSPGGDAYGLGTCREVRVEFPSLDSLQGSWLGRTGEKRALVVAASLRLHPM